MANLGEKLSVGDREGVVVRAVATAEGEEVTIRIPNAESPRPVSYAQPNEELEAAEEDRRTADADDEDAPASQPQTGTDKPLGDAPASQPQTGTDKPLTKAPAKGTGNKAAGSK